MEAGYEVEVSTAAQEEARSITDDLALDLGDGPSDRVNDQIRMAIRGLAANPTRHTRVRYLIGRRFVYRRVLVGSYYRVIFTIDEDARRVEVIRVDSQLSDPATLDDLP